MSLYMQLSGKRPAGMGVGPIGSEEIEAFARRHQIDISLFEHELLDRIDAAFRAGVNLALKVERQSSHMVGAPEKGGASHGRARQRH